MQGEEARKGSKGKQERQGEWILVISSDQHTSSASHPHPTPHLPPSPAPPLSPRRSGCFVGSGCAACAGSTLVTHCVIRATSPSIHSLCLASPLGPQAQLFHSPSTKKNHRRSDEQALPQQWMASMETSESRMLAVARLAMHRDTQG
jgi:hypothetical protein